MEFGFAMPSRGPLATPEAIAALAAKAEQLGFRHLAVPDHIVLPRSYGSRYPYAPSGKLTNDTGEFLEQLALMAHIGAITRGARILSSVMVVPHRPAVFTAKALATIDVLTGGRVDVGIGAGWLREEFEAIGAPDFDARGRVTNAYLEAFKELWTAEDPDMRNGHVGFSGISFAPKPVQKPHPPLWIGGESGPALRRTARYGDVWYPIGANPRHPLDTFGRYAAGVARMRSEAEGIGRDPAEIALAFWANWYAEDLERETDSGERFILTGPDHVIAEDAARLKEFGVTRLLFNFLRPSLAETTDAIERFAGNIMAKV